MTEGSDNRFERLDEDDFLSGHELDAETVKSLKADIEELFPNLLHRAESGSGDTDVEIGCEAYGEISGVAAAEVHLWVNLADNKKLRIFHSLETGKGLGGMEWRMIAVTPQEEGERRYSVMLRKDGKVDLEVDIADQNLPSTDFPRRTDFEDFQKFVSEAKDRYCS